MIRICLAVCVTAAAITAGPRAGGQNRSADQRTPTLIVSGSGEVKAAPDTAYVTLGVISQGGNAAEASQSNAAIAQRISDALKHDGIAEKDLQTSGYSVQTLYRDNNPAHGIGRYQVNNEVRATVRKLDAIGKVIDDGLAAGANSVQGVAFGLEERKAHEDAALTRAIEEARRKADAIARAAGVHIAGIQQITSGVGREPTPLGEPMSAMSMRMATPIAPGELTVAESVIITFRLAEGVTQAEGVRAARVAALASRRTALAADRERMATLYSAAHPQMRNNAKALAEIDREIAAVTAGK